MDIHYLRVFAAVYRLRSFTGASEELHLTQPTVSDHIKTLEEELGVRLFDRLGRSVIPTREAEILYTRTLDILERFDNLPAVIREAKNEISGELVIGASTIPGTYLLPEIVVGIQRKWPSLSFNIKISDSKDVTEKVMRTELFIGIVGSRILNSQIVYQPLVEDKLVAVSSPSLIKNRIIPLRELLKYPMVIREEGSGTRREMERILESRGLRLEDLRIAGIFGSTDSVKEAVKKGLGYTIISYMAVRDELKRKTLKEIVIEGIPEMKRRFYLIHHKKRSLPRVYQLFIQELETWIHEYS